MSASRETRRDEPPYKDPLEKRLSRLFTIGKHPRSRRSGSSILIGLRDDSSANSIILIVNTIQLLWLWREQKKRAPAFVLLANKLADALTLMDKPNHKLAKINFFTKICVLRWCTTRCCKLENSIQFRFCQRWNKSYFKQFF